MAMVTDDVPLVDQHCHGVVTEELDEAAFAGALTEAPRLPPHRDPFDSLLGLGIRRWCAPVLDLPPHADRVGYLVRRAELGWREVTGRLLRAAGVTRWLVDTGFVPAWPLTAPEPSREIIRIEHVAETLAAHGESSLDTIRAGLRAPDAIGLKTIIAYRTGLAVPASAPGDQDAARALDRWLRSGNRRLTDPVLLAWLVHEAAIAGAELGRPLQVHTGFGDPDLRLPAANPALLHDFLESTADTTVVLLHCWPYHREAAYLAHAFPNVIVDIGLTLPFTGARAGAVLAETLELAPFDAVVYSSDGRILPETHHLAAALWRHHLGRLLDAWIADEVITIWDAERLAHGMGHGNAARVYPG
jgi:uncharacterized protein